MTTSARVLVDSLSPAGDRLTTFEVTFHRFILAEVNTHRVLSRNYRSSRAVPSAKLIEEVRTNPAMPVYWGKNVPGMQARAELTGPHREDAILNWKVAARAACDHATWLSQTGLHKQIANRVLEPFTWVHGVVTATEWDNFFGLRLHRDAQPEFRALAEAMWKARSESKPNHLRPGKWHLPYVQAGDVHDLLHRHHPDRDAAIADLIKVSVARCARVSVRPFDADRPSTFEEDLALYTKLVGAQPVHASPAEHQATPDLKDSYEDHRGWWWSHESEHGNFHGWRQYRKMLPGESTAPLPEEYR